MRISSERVGASKFLGSILTADTLLDYAGEKSFARGKKYQQAGRVEGLCRRGDRISGTVLGTEEYAVSLRAGSRELTFKCDCPVGEDGVFCKHCVALGLEWLEQADDDDDGDSLRSALTALDKNELIELILDHAMSDPAFHRKIALVATPASVADLKKAIDRAMKSRSFIDYYHMPAYAKVAGQVINQIEDVQADGRHVDAIELCEHALRAVECSLPQCDDSDGYMGALLCRLQDIHLDSCVACRPDPVALARRLFAWEVGSPWEVFYGAAGTYGELLGEAGLAEYRRLADAEWEKLPPLRPGDNESDTTLRFRITSMKEAIARAANDLDGLVEIAKKNLSAPYHYLAVANLYVEMKQPELAIDWASRGIEAFPSRYDARLGLLVANQYEALGDEYRSMEAAWSVFCHDPGFRSYPELKERAERLDQWDLWRPKAFSAMRDDIAKARTGFAQGYSHRDGSELVSVLLWEGNVEAAWTEAREGGCSSRLWLELAEKREALHPADSLPIYMTHVERSVSSGVNSGYEAAVAYVERIRRIESPEKFALYVESLRNRYKAKRNFMKLLSERGW